jgi:hypothetical protein
MTTPHAIRALIEKRAELAGKLADLERQKNAIRVQINHVDHVLAIMGYGEPPRLIRAVRPKANRFANRELGKFIRELERDKLALTNRDAALKIIEAKGWDASDRDLLHKVVESIKSAKKQLRRAARTR